MRKLLVLAASIALALPAVSNADGGPPPRPRGNPHGPPAWHGGGDHHDDRHDDRDDDHEGGYRYDNHHYDGDHRSYGYPRYYPTYRYYGHSPAPYYYYGGGGGHHNHGGDNDDALWAIGGLIVGAVVGTVVEQSKQKTATSVSSGPPAGCRDVIVYDSKGEPRVQRDCN